MWTPDRRYLLDFLSSSASMMLTCWGEPKKLNWYEQRLKSVINPSAFDWKLIINRFLEWFRKAQKIDWVETLCSSNTQQSFGTKLKKFRSNVRFTCNELSGGEACELQPPTRSALFIMIKNLLSLTPTMNVSRHRRWKYFISVKPTHIATFTVLSTWLHKFWSFKFNKNIFINFWYVKVIKT